MHDNTIYLCSPLNALVEGIYEENVSLREIKEHGDFGLGTFNDLDGEMVILDGNVYQVRSDGCVTVVRDDEKTPFAGVVFYRPLSCELFDHEMDYETFTIWINRLLPSPNLLYAIRVDGLFAHVKTRSVPKQENYRPLVEVTKEQPTFNFTNLEGTLAGFFTPSFMASVSVPGLHLHFLSADLKCGGHLLECRPPRGRIGIQFVNKLELSLPISVDYLTWDFTRDMHKDLNEADR
jgi:acetolactate decarboxylase